MKLALARHPVLVTTSLSPAALERLETFFDVDVKPLDGSMTSAELHSLLCDRAGVVVNADIVFDEALIRRLPMLKAISVMAPSAPRLDLDALTAAGVRATRLPLLDDIGEAGACRMDLVAAEALVSSLGFGRRGFHPPYLLNPDVICTSCC